MRAMEELVLVCPSQDLLDLRTKYISDNKEFRHAAPSSTVSCEFGMESRTAIDIYIHPRFVSGSNSHPSRPLGD